MNNKHLHSTLSCVLSLNHRSLSRTLHSTYQLLKIIAPSAASMELFENFSSEINISPEWLVFKTIGRASTLAWEGDALFSFECGVPYNVEVT